MSSMWGASAPSWSCATPFTRSLTSRPISSGNPSVAMSASHSHRLFFGGKELQDTNVATGKEFNLYDYDVGKNGVNIMLMIRQAPAEPDAAAPAPAPVVAAPIASAPTGEKKDEKPSPEDLSIIDATDAEVKEGDNMVRRMMHCGNLHRSLCAQHLFCKFNDKDEGTHATDHIPWVRTPVV